MEFFRNLFNRKKTTLPVRTERFLGRYSDNNKSVAKTRDWDEAESLFKEGKFTESFIAFLRYLRDDSLNNVLFAEENNGFRFDIFQGSKVIRGECKENRLTAKVVLAGMPEPSVPVMRRLLEQNFQLFYSRYSLHSGRLYMQLESDLDGANPNKMYYALKELAVVSDRQDDLLLQDFHSIQKIDSDHILPMPDEEKAVRYKYFRFWLETTLNSVKKMDAEKHAGGISFLLLATLFRIDFLITPEGKLRNEIEKAQSAFFKKDGASAIDKNRDLTRAMEKLNTFSKEEMYGCLFYSVSTFSIRQPRPHAVVVEAIQNAHASSAWYRDNQFPDYALQILEFGLSYPQYAYSLPRPLTEMFQLLMEMNHPEFFREIGYAYTLYDTATGQFRIEETEKAIMDIVNRWKGKYPGLVFPRERLSFQTLYEFNRTFTEILAAINFDNKI